MTRKDLIKVTLESLRSLRKWQLGQLLTTEEQCLLSTSVMNSDKSTHHVFADELLIECIGDKEVKEAFRSIEKWYE